MKRCEFQWSDDFVRRIDQARGDVPRSKFVQRALEAALERGLAGERGGSPSPASKADLAPAPPRASEIAEKLGLPTASQMAKRNVKPIPKRS